MSDERRITKEDEDDLINAPGIPSKAAQSEEKRAFSGYRNQQLLLIVRSCVGVCSKYFRLTRAEILWWKQEAIWKEALWADAFHLQVKWSENLSLIAKRSLGVFLNWQFSDHHWNRENYHLMSESLDLLDWSCCKVTMKLYCKDIDLKRSNLL